MRLALWQDHSPMGDEAAALAAIAAASRAAGAMGAAVLVLPEVFLPGYNHGAIPDRAISRTDPVLNKVAAMARDAGCGIVIGYAERDGASVYNSAVLFDAAGETVAHYRKIQLYGPREKALYLPGTQYTIFDLHGQKAALLICYDIEFAPHVAALAAQGVTIILVPTANMEPYDHVARSTVPAMAANHGVTIIYANYCGVEGDLTYVGSSVIAGPHGEVLAQAGKGPALLMVEVPDRDMTRLTTQGIDFRPV